METTVLDELLSYTTWANETILTLLEKYGTAVPAPALRLMSHVVDAQSTWLVRIQGVAPVVGVWEEHDLAGCRRLNAETLEGFKTLMNAPDFDPGKKASYKNSAGVAYVNTLHDMLLQAFTHGGYHRGQIALLLRQQGLEPVNTDYIVWVRQR